MLPYYSDATMWGPQGDPNKERPRLKPGDRLADGRVFMGDDPTAVLEAQLERVLLELKPLETRRDELLARLAQLAPEKYGAGQAATSSKEETAPPATPPAGSGQASKPKTLRQAQDKAKRGG